MAADEAVVVALSSRKGRARMAFLIEQYYREHPDEDRNLLEPHLVARWAIQRGVYNRPPADPEELLRRELSRYLKNEYITDPQGRQVRHFHAVVYEVQTADGVKRRSRWHEIFDAPAKHMQAALQLRRKGALSDVVQMHLDFESYNDNNTRQEKLQPMDFNFNKDLEEMSLPSTYPEDGPDDDFDEEI